MRTRKRQTRTKYKEVDMNNISSELIVNGCEAEDVIAFGTKMHKIDHIASAFKRQIRAIAGQINTILNNCDGFTIPLQAFLEGGHDCEILSANSVGWKKGKVKIKFEIEFIPDDVEVICENVSPSSDSTLDSLRAMTN